jgi:hypothetical protein
LSERDLEELRPRVVAARVTRMGERRLVTVPWGAEAVRSSDSAGSPASTTRVVVAMDARGQIAVACYEAPSGGLSIEALDLVAPPLAAPVLRGQTRVRPGEPRGAAAPIALMEGGGVLDLGAGASGEGDAEKTLGDWLRAYEEGRSSVAPAPPPMGVLSVALVGRESKVLGRAREAG